jgi:hypothetical protein
MPLCSICGEKLGPYARICHMCGTSLPDSAEPRPPAKPVVPHSPSATSSCPPGSRLCPSCGQTFGPDFTDVFCACGTELIEPPPPPAAAKPGPASVGVAQRPPSGTPCIVLFGPDKKPLRYFPLTKDAVLIGRLDAVAGIFPDIDVTEYLDQASARKVSRQHALVLRSRASKTFSLRPLAGNTGTQIEADMVPPLEDHPLASGTRLILGGTVRLKFEVT